MTKPARDANLRWSGFLLAVLVAVLVTLFGAGTASAAPAAQTRAGAPSVESQVVLGPWGGIDAARRLGSTTSTYDSVLATGVAAEDPLAVHELALGCKDDVAAPSYDASVLFVDAPTVAQVPAVGHHATVVSLGGQSRVALCESAVVSGFVVAAKGGGGLAGRLRSLNWSDDTGAVSWGRGGQKLSPDDAAGGAPHSTFRRGPDGVVTHYVEWTPNARSPSGYDIAKRYDGVGGSHYDKVTGMDVPTPHVQGPWGVRSAEPWEIP